MRSIIGSVAALRPITPFAAPFVLLVVFAGGGMVVIAREADVSDASRTREAPTRVLSAALATLGAGVEMNVATGPVAKTLSDPHGAPASAYVFFPFTSPGAFGYHGTVVLNPDGTAFRRHALRAAVDWLDVRRGGTPDSPHCRSAAGTWECDGHHAPPG